MYVSAGYTSGGIVGKGRYVDLKLNFQKTNIIACGPITSWQIDGKKMEIRGDFIFLGSKTTEDGDCSHEIKRHLLLDSKVMSNIDSILKSRHHCAKDLYSQSCFQQSYTDVRIAP